MPHVCYYEVPSGVFWSQNRKQTTRRIYIYMSNYKNDSEGLVIAWGLLIMLVSIVGGFATGMGPIEFLIIGSFWFFIVGGIVLLLIALAIAIVKSVRDSKTGAFSGVYGDENERLEMFKSEFVDALREMKKLFIRHQ